MEKAWSSGKTIWVLPAWLSHWTWFSKCKERKEKIWQKNIKKIFILLLPLIWSILKCSFTFVTFPASNGMGLLYTPALGRSVAPEVSIWLGGDCNPLRLDRPSLRLSSSSCTCGDMDDGLKGLVFSVASLPENLYLFLLCYFIDMLTLVSHCCHLSDNVRKGIEELGKERK